MNRSSKEKRARAGMLSGIDEANYRDMEKHCPGKGKIYDPPAGHGTGVPEAAVWEGNGRRELDKSILKQYTNMQQEQQDIQQRIAKLEDDILDLEENRSETADSVTCGRKGKKALKTVKISGFPEMEYQTKIGRLKRLRMRLELADDQLLELLFGVEEYIESIEDSRMRMIMRFRYMDSMTWKQVAARIKSASEESVRKEHDRFLEKK